MIHAPRYDWLDTRSMQKLISCEKPALFDAKEESTTPWAWGKRGTLGQILVSSAIVAVLLSAGDPRTATIPGAGWSTHRMRHHHPPLALAAIAGQPVHGLRADSHRAFPPACST